MMLDQNAKSLGSWLLRRVMLFGSWGVCVVVILKVTFAVGERAAIDPVLIMAAFPSMVGICGTYVFGAAFENKAALPFMMRPRPNQVLPENDPDAETYETPQATPGGYKWE